LKEESSLGRAILRAWLSKWTARDMLETYKTQTFLLEASKLGWNMKTSQRSSSLFGKHRL
jgi:hypothetical protein